MKIVRGSLAVALLLACGSTAVAVDPCKCVVSLYAQVGQTYWYQVANCPDGEHDGDEFLEFGSSMPTYDPPCSCHDTDCQNSALPTTVETFSMKPLPHKIGLPDLEAATKPGKRGKPRNPNDPNGTITNHAVTFARDDIVQTTVAAGDSETRLYFRLIEIRRGGNNPRFLVALELDIEDLTPEQLASEYPKMKQGATLLKGPAGFTHVLIGIPGVPHPVTARTHTELK
jgi:hypothetical protein